MEPGSEAGAVLLCMLFDTERTLADSMKDDTMFPLCVQLRGGGLMDALEATFPDGERVQGWFRRAAEPVLLILLYVCSQDADFMRAGVPGRPSRSQSERAAQACGCIRRRRPRIGILACGWAPRCGLRRLRSRTPKARPARASRPMCGARTGTHSSPAQ